jgi:chromosomal replication initiator protein
VRQAETSSARRIKIEPPLQINPLRAFNVSFERLLPDFYLGEENAGVLDLFAPDRLADLCVYSPILLYGPNGSGKTALAHSLQCRWENHYGSKRALQISANDFSRYLAGAIAADDMTHFRERTRGASSLFIDSLEGISNKFTAQDELISVIDEHHDHERPLFITTVELPQSIRGLKKSLVSRLSGGTAVGIKYPSRAALWPAIERLHREGYRQSHHPIALGHFLEQLPLNLSLNAVRGMLMDYLTSSHRQDESQNRLGLALGDATEDKVAEQTTKEDCKLIEKIIRARDPSLNIKAPQIIRAVAKHSGCALSDLKGATRKSQIVRARSLAMYLCRILAQMPLEKIGQHFGNRDHTTVIHAVRKIESQIESDPLLMRLKNDTLRELKQVTS